jgi:hypothetical protein
MKEAALAQPAPLPYMHSQWQETIAGIPVTFESEADAKRFLATLKANTFLSEKEMTQKFVGDVKANFLDEVKRAQPAQEPKNQTLFGYEIFGCFFRNFDDALNAFKNQGLTWATPDGPFNGMNEDWIKKNIREVYVHGTSELERLNNIGNGGPINTQTD